MADEKYVRARVLSPGLACGQIFLAGTGESSRTGGVTVEEELRRFEEQVRHIAAELAELFRRVSREIHPKDAEILQAQQMILEDGGFREKVVRLISEEFLPVEQAVEQVMKAFARRLENSSSEYMRERAKDFLDLVGYFRNRSFEAGGRPMAGMKAGAVLVVDELFLSAVLHCKKTKAAGIVARNGTPNSHAAILARAFGLPVLVTSSPELDRLQNGTPVVLDAFSGTLVLFPSPETLRRITLPQKMLRDQAGGTGRVDPGEACTTDGVRITLGANIERMDELHLFSPDQVDEIGLFRTEFLFMFDQEDFPAFDQQVEWYRTVVLHMKGKPVTFRVLDVGGDKFLPYFSMGKQDNPYLGLRAHRVFRYHPEVLETQLRAILEAARLGPVRILYPMINTLEEVDFLNKILFSVLADKNVEVGMMVETPASVFMIHELLEKVDFVSLGTNDLVQYALTVDRNNENVMAFYHPFHPVILRMLARVAEEASRAGKPVSICGEIASDPRWTPLLLGMGIRSLSMSPILLAPVKRQIRALDFGECRELARKAVSARYEEEVQHLLDAFLAERNVGMPVEG
jgi:phosphotransferase system enzyme I (PtsI)